MLPLLRCRKVSPLLTNYCFGLALRHLPTWVAILLLPPLPRSPGYAFGQPRLGSVRQLRKVRFFGSDALVASLCCSANALPFFCLLGKLLRSYVVNLFPLTFELLADGCFRKAV